MGCFALQLTAQPPHPLHYNMELNKTMQGNITTSPGILNLASVQSFKVKHDGW